MGVCEKGEGAVTLHFHRSLRAVAFSAAVLVSACSPTVTVHGYVPTQEDIELIEPGVDTIGSIEDRIGRPSTTNLLGDAEWYYIQTTMEQLTYNPAWITDRTVLVIAFDDDGVVEDVASYGLEDGRIIDLSTRVTPTGGQRRNVLQRIFGSLLNFEAGSFLE